MKRKRIEKNWLEWAVFAAGLLLVAGALGFLVYDGATAGDSPPDIEIALGTPLRRGASFLVPVRVTNRGGRTAEGVHVEVALEGTEERGEFVVAFLPRRSAREGFVAFQSDPSARRLNARVLGFEEP